MNSPRFIERFIEWYQSNDFRKDVADRTLKIIQIFIFVGFGYLLGWYSVALEVSKCEVDMKKLSHENARMMLQITEEHKNSLEKQRNSYQNIIKNELKELTQKVEVNKNLVEFNHRQIDQNGKLIDENKKRLSNAVDIGNSR